MLLLFLSSLITLINCSLLATSSSSHTKPASQNNPSSPLPSNYSLIDVLKTSFPVQKLLYSPDEQFIVYTKLGNYESNVVYFRKRSVEGSEYNVNVGDPKV